MFNKSVREVILFLAITFNLFVSQIFAASFADNAKKAMKEYGGYKELVNRGFNLKMLNTISTPEDLYNVLLPYMIVDEKPLDNCISFNGFNFARHKSIKFENEYGTIDELLGKGYKSEDLFYYPSKGKDIYRVGHYKWEPVKETVSIYADLCYYNRPFMGKKIAYFFPGFFTQDYFKPYIKEIKNKEAIVVDCRMCSGWGQLYNLGEALCSSNYKGKVIVIIDRTTGSNVENDIVNNMRTSYYINGSNKNIAFEWITVGENTKGTTAYVNNAKWNYEVGDLKFNPLPVEVNKWPTSKEGEGVEPNIWALGDEDINKTIEILTGETDFAELIKDVTEWRSFICSSEKILWNWQLKLPDAVKKIKDNDEYNKTVAELIKSSMEYSSIIDTNRDLLYNIGGWYFELPACAPKSKSAKEFSNDYIKWVDAQVKFISFLLDNRDKKVSYWMDYPECFTNCNSFTTLADYFSKWIYKRLEWCEIAVKVNSKINNEYILGVNCAKNEKNIQEYWSAFENQMNTEIKWILFRADNVDKLINFNWNLQLPENVMNCPSYKTFADCYSKLMDIQIEWDDFYIKKLVGVSYTWWDIPEFFKSYKTIEQFTDYYIRWMSLRIWWCGILAENDYVLKHNNIRVWYDALKEEIKEWNNPEKHLTELTDYLKNLEPWIEYLQPHPYVIPKDMKMAKYYGSMHRTSDKIGESCSAVPEEIRKLQKTNPELYVEKMVAYINSVAENDFEKVKIVFDIEQEILTYDHATYQQDLKKINEAKKGVGEDYEQYSKNMQALNKENTEERAKQDWKSVLEAGICVCEGYARLMQYFCYKFGIKCDVVGNPKDMMFAVGHAWNIVQINGEDYFIDATWGRNYLYMEPQQFLTSGHFPTEPEQQLLKTPMTLDEYKKLKDYKGNNS